MKHDWKRGESDELETQASRNKNDWICKATSVLRDRLAAGIIVIVAVPVAVVSIRGLPEADQRKLGADAFVWPENCAPAAYANGHSIHRSCAVPSSAIIDLERIGPTYNARFRGKHYRFCGFGHAESSVYTSLRGDFVVKRGNNTYRCTIRIIDSEAEIVLISDNSLEVVSMYYNQNAGPVA